MATRWPALSRLYTSTPPPHVGGKNAHTTALREAVPAFARLSGVHFRHRAALLVCCPIKRRCPQPLKSLKVPFRAASKAAWS